MICDMCKGLLERRSDDRIDTIKERLKTYYEHESSMIDFYREHGYRLHQFNGDKGVEDIFVEFNALAGVEQHT